MTRALVIADSGTAMAALTQSLRRMPDLEIVRYASGRHSIALIARASQPDLVLIDEMHWREAALARLAEARREAPGAAIVVLAAERDAGWLADALRAGAAAVLPGGVDDATLELVLREVLVTDPQVHSGTSLAA
jgi:two-component system, NarL family, response regulator DesR